MSKAEIPSDVDFSGPIKVAEKPQSDLPAAFGKFTLTKRLGRGGMAEAFLAQTHAPSGFQKTLVIKRMLPRIADDEDFVRMFQREARLAALLTHTNVVQIYELGEIDGIQFIGMEYIDGAGLNHLVTGAWRNALTIPLEIICCAIADAALGLAAAHDLCDENGRNLGIVHRDISPDNLMINREGVTKILDFGVARSADGEKTAAGLLKGKLAFLAPEQVLGKAIDGRTDLYALGVTFYSLVTGKRPFAGKSEIETLERIVAGGARPPWELNPTLPKRVNDLIMRLLAKDPQNRPQHAGEVHDELADALTSRRSIVVPFVREFLAGRLPTGDDVPGGVFCRATAVGTALRAWPKVEGAEDSTENAIPTRIMNVPVGEPETALTAQDLESSGDGDIVGPLTMDISQVEELFPTEGAPADPHTGVATVPSRPAALLDAAVTVPQRPAAAFEPLDTLASLPSPSPSPASSPALSPASEEGLVLPSFQGAAVSSAAVAAPDLELPPLAAPRSKALPLLAAAAAAVGAVFLIVHFANGSEQTPVPPAIALSPTVDPVAPPTVVTPPTPTPPEPTPPEPTPPEPAKPIETTVKQTTLPKETKTETKTETKAEAKSVRVVEVQARAPAGIQWQVGGKSVGTGTATLKLAAAADSVVALDRQRGGRSVVPVVGGVADYGALARGKLHPRANPYAEVFLGTQSLGTTPFAPVELPVGTWSLRFVHDGKTEERSVTVTAGAVAKVSVSFE